MLTAHSDTAGSLEKETAFNSVLASNGMKKLILLYTSSRLVHSLSARKPQYKNMHKRFAYDALPLLVSSASPQ